MIGGAASMDPVTDAPLLTKFVIGDLALRSALQLEKARKQRAFSPDPLLRLATALCQTSFPPSADAAAAMRPGFYESFSRLSFKVGPEPATQEHDIGGMLEWAVGGLRELAEHKGIGEASDRLVDFCVQLHDEFVGRPAAEARFERPGTVSAPARLH